MHGDQIFAMVDVRQVDYSARPRESSQSSRCSTAEPHSSVVKTSATTIYAAAQRGVVVPRRDPALRRPRRSYDIAAVFDDSWFRTMRQASHLASPFAPSGEFRAATTASTNSADRASSAPASIAISSASSCNASTPKAPGARRCQRRKDGKVAAPQVVLENGFGTGDEVFRCRAFVTRASAMSPS